MATLPESLEINIVSNTSNDYNHDFQLDYIKYILDPSSGNKLHSTIEHNALSISPSPSSSPYISNCLHSINISFPLKYNASTIYCSGLNHNYSITNITAFSDIISVSITFNNSNTPQTQQPFLNNYHCDEPLFITLPHHQNLSNNNTQCYIFNENEYEWSSAQCITLEQTINATQCACYHHLNSHTNTVSFLLSNPNSFSFDESASFANLLSDFTTYSNTEISVVSIIFISIAWLFTFFCYCCAPIHDDIPLISKNVIIPSHFRYRMFTHTKEGRINDLLRHSDTFNICRRLYRLICVYSDNSHLCFALWNRDIGTNLYHCDRILLLILHILCIAFLSLLFALIQLNMNEFISMFYMGMITFLLCEILMRCMALSTPQRLQPATIELLVESESARIQQMKERTVLQCLPRQSELKLFDAQYWSDRFVLAEKEIKKIIHNDQASRSLVVDVAKWDATQTGIWIHSLGLARYQSEFEHHHIDGKKLLRLHLQHIELYVKEKKDIEFLHGRLHKLKVKWRYRFVQLRERRKLAKDGARKVAKERQDKLKREKFLQSVRVQSVNNEILQQAKKKGVAGDHGLRTTFRNFSTMFRHEHKNNDDAVPKHQSGQGSHSRLSNLFKKHTDDMDGVDAQSPEVSEHDHDEHDQKTLTLSSRENDSFNKSTNRFQHWKYQLTQRFNQSLEEEDEDRLPNTKLSQANRSTSHNSQRSGAHYAVDLDQVTRYLTYFEAEDKLNKMNKQQSGKSETAQTFIIKSPPLSNMATLTDNSADFHGHTGDDNVADHDNMAMVLDEEETVESVSVSVHVSSSSPPSGCDDIKINPYALTDGEHDEYDHDYEESIEMVVPIEAVMNAPKPMWKPNANPQQIQNNNDNNSPVTLPDNIDTHNTNLVQNLVNNFNLQNTKTQNENTIQCKTGSIRPYKITKPKRNKSAKLPPLPSQKGNNKNTKAHKQRYNIRPKRKSMIATNRLSLAAIPSQAAVDESYKPVSKPDDNKPIIPTLIIDNNNKKNRTKSNIVLPTNSPNKPTDFKSRSFAVRTELKSEKNKIVNNNTGFNLHKKDVFLPYDTKLADHETTVSNWDDTKLAETETSDDNLQQMWHDIAEHKEANTATPPAISTQVIPPQPHPPDVSTHLEQIIQNIKNMRETERNSPILDDISDVPIPEEKEVNIPPSIQVNASQVSMQTAQQIHHELMQTTANSHRPHVSIDYKRAASNLGTEGLFDSPTPNAAETDEEFSVSKSQSSIYALKRKKKGAHTAEEEDIEEPETPQTPLPDTPVPVTILMDNTTTSMSMDSMMSAKTENEENVIFGEGDFVYLILRDANNLVVLGIVQSYNTMSHLADVRILPSKSHNRGNDVERFVEATDLRQKGFRLNDLAVLQFSESIDDYPLGFDLDYDAFKADKMFADKLIEGWESGTIAKPNAFELFDGLKVRIKEVNPSGMVIVTILPSSRAQQYLLGQRSIKIDIVHIMSLNVYHDKKEHRQSVNNKIQDGIDIFGDDKDVYTALSTPTGTLRRSLKNLTLRTIASQGMLDRGTTDRSVETTGGLQRLGTEHAMQQMHDIDIDGKAGKPHIILLKRNTMDSMRSTDASVTSAHVGVDDGGQIFNEQVFNVSMDIYDSAFAADKDVIRDDFIQRRRIMREHYNFNHHCRTFIRCIVVLLCIYLSVFIVCELHLAKQYDISVDSNSNIVKCSGTDMSMLFNDTSLLHDGINNIEWYWFSFTIICILIYNFVIFFIYYFIFSMCLIMRQDIYKKYKFDPLMIPFVVCYGSNRYRMHKVVRQQFNDSFNLKDRISGISSPTKGVSKRKNTKKLSLCLCCVSSQKIQLSLETVASKANAINTASTIRVEDYGNADLCFTIWCCYFRCLNSCHYGFRQGPNAPRLLTFFDPIKHQE